MTLFSELFNLRQKLYNYNYIYIFEQLPKRHNVQHTHISLALLCLGI